MPHFYLEDIKMPFVYIILNPIKLLLFWKSKRVEK